MGQDLGKPLQYIVPAVLAMITGGAIGGAMGGGTAAAEASLFGPEAGSIAGTAAETIPTTTASTLTGAASSIGDVPNLASNPTGDYFLSGSPVNYSSSLLNELPSGGFDVTGMNMTTSNPLMAQNINQAVQYGTPAALAGGGAGLAAASALPTSGGGTTLPVSAEILSETAPSAVDLAGKTGLMSETGAVKSAASWLGNPAMQTGGTMTPSLWESVLGFAKDKPLASLLIANTALGGATNYLRDAETKKRYDDYISALQGRQGAAGSEYLANNVLTPSKINAIMGNVLGQQSSNRNAYLEKLSGSAAEAGRGGGSVASRLEKFNREARTTAARTYADLLAKEGTGGDLSAYLAKYGAGVNTMPPAGPTEGALGGVSQTLGNIPTWLMLSKLFEKI